MVATVTGNSIARQGAIARVGVGKVGAVSSPPLVSILYWRSPRTPWQRRQVSSMKSGAFGCPLSWGWMVRSVSNWARKIGSRPDRPIIEYRHSPLGETLTLQLVGGWLPGSHVCRALG